MSARGDGALPGLHTSGNELCQRGNDRNGEATRSHCRFLMAGPGAVILVGFAGGATAA